MARDLRPLLPGASSAALLQLLAAWVCFAAAHALKNLGSLEGKRLLLRSSYLLRGKMSCLRAGCSEQLCLAHNLCNYHVLHAFTGKSVADLLVRDSKRGIMLKWSAPSAGYNL